MHRQLHTLNLSLLSQWKKSQYQEKIQKYQGKKMLYRTCIRSQVYLMAINQDLLISDRQWKCLYPGENYRKNIPLLCTLDSCTDKLYSLESIFLL